MTQNTPKPWRIALVLPNGEIVQCVTSEHVEALLKWYYRHYRADAAAEVAA